DREKSLKAVAKFGAVATPFATGGMRIPPTRDEQRHPNVEAEAAFQRGWFEVQDEGSQVAALLTGARPGVQVLDFCAGAGGKTLALGASMRNTGRLYAFDVAGHRLEALKPRLARSGLSNVYPVQIAHERDERIKRLAGKIDRVLVDAPCSGLGTLRRNPDLKWRQSPKAVQELNVKQIAILAGAARLLKAGGRLVYATCSLLASENEAVCEAFATAHPDFQRLPMHTILSDLKVPGAADLSNAGNLRLWPHLHATDGFFAAIWTKT
ncbi:MAG TPA: RsmB/NOP family class I SAM-dependent RNA methyltransferase, partial [Steroidobacteraceae bacterium]|nr:RsmB/NOP family class I SAM-dependent RNA methyltransferase [Steroidobacteraceae bacterium]